MKKTSLIFAFGALFSVAQAQVFTEDFSSEPAGWTIIDNDGGTLNTANGNLTTAGWHAGTIQGDGVMQNSSWYTDASVQSDDWLISPMISLPSLSSGVYVLEMNMFSASGNFQDEYQILVSTTDAQPSSFTAITNPAEAPAVLENVEVAVLDGYAGQDIYIAIRVVSTDEFVLYLSEFTVRSIADEFDIELVTIGNDRGAAVGGTGDYAVTIRNKGYGPITEFSMEIAGTGTVETISNINVPFNGTYTTDAFSTPVSSLGLNTFDLQLELNGDADMSNNSGEFEMYGLTEVPFKRVVIEEGTGTWCGWCPRGTVAMDQAGAQFQDSIVLIAVHNGDPMAVAAHDDGLDLSGYPGGRADRVAMPGMSFPAVEAFFDAFKNNRPLSDVSGLASYDAAADEVNLTVSVTPRTPIENLESQYKISVVAIEDWVTGTGSGYSQSNFYSGGNQGPMGGYENKANPVPASEMVYRYVSRGFVSGGFDGEALLQGSVSENETIEVNLDYSVPSNVAIGNLSFAVLLIDPLGTIENAFTVRAIENVVSVEEISNNFELLYDFNQSTISFASQDEFVADAVGLYDINGRLVHSFEQTVITDGSTFSLGNIAAGSYIFIANGKDASLVKKVIVQ